MYAPPDTGSAPKSRSACRVLRTIWSTDGFPEDAGREEEAGADEEDVAWADDGDEAECEALLELEPEVWELPARTAEGVPKAAAAIAATRPVRRRRVMRILLRMVSGVPARWGVYGGRA